MNALVRTTPSAIVHRRRPLPAVPEADAAVAEPALPRLVERATRQLLAGRLDEAERLCGEVLARDPRHADGHHLLGMVAYQRRAYDEAARRYRRAAALARANALYHSNLGGALEALGKRKEAAVRYRRAIALRPGLAEAHYNLGNALRAQWKLDEAIESYRRALAIKPELIQARTNLGNLLRDRGELEEALDCYRRVLEIAPNCAEAHANWGSVLRAQGRLDEAMAKYRHAIALAPALAEAHYNLANILQSLAGEDRDKLLAAAEVYRDALAVKPALVEAHYNLGCIHTTLGEPEEGLRHHRRAVEAQPHFAKARFAEAILELQLGDYARGWADYEWRWKSPDHDTRWRPFAQPLWRGETPAAGRVLVWGEQGIGDEILFAGLIPEALATLQGPGGGLALDCDPRLQPLFARSFPGVEVVSGMTPDDPRLERLGVAAHLPSGSLPGRFRNAETDFPTTSPATGVAYLKADPAVRRRLRGRYAAGGGAPLIGLAWHSRNPRTGQRRSMPLPLLAPLLTQPRPAGRQVRWISLQYGDHGELQAEVDAAFTEGIRPLAVDCTVDALADLDAFAAQVAAMDLVLTIDNSTAHLAGALGVPVWVLLPLAADWRWQQRREDSPWYPSMRLFRQPRQGDWSAVVARVACELDRFLAGTVPATRSEWPICRPAPKGRRYPSP